MKVKIAFPPSKAKQIQIITPTLTTSGGKKKKRERIL